MAPGRARELLAAAERRLKTVARRLEKASRRADDGTEFRRLQFAISQAAVRFVLAEERAGAVRRP